MEILQRHTLREYATERARVYSDTPRSCCSTFRLQRRPVQCRHDFNPSSLRQCRCVAAGCCKHQSSVAASDVAEDVAVPAQRERVREGQTVTVRNTESGAKS